jgi:hypothetical protein
MPGVYKFESLMKQTSSSPPDSSAAVYLEHLNTCSWYTADPHTPYLVKACANNDSGYQILITDLKNTYFCAGDRECIKNEKKVRHVTKTNQH